MRNARVTPSNILFGHTLIYWSHIITYFFLFSPLNRFSKQREKPTQNTNSTIHHKSKTTTTSSTLSTPSSFLRRQTKSSSTTSSCCLSFLLPPTYPLFLEKLLLQVSSLSLHIISKFPIRIISIFLQPSITWRK